MGRVMFFKGLKKKVGQTLKNLQLDCSFKMVSTLLYGGV
jgi:hypothetical protein